MDLTRCRALLIGALLSGSWATAASAQLPDQVGGAPSPEVAVVLDRIQMSDHQLKGVRADLKYSVVQLLKANPDDPEEVQHFFGNVLFLNDPPTSRFHIHFRYWTDGRLKYREEQWFVFDGTWLTHVDEKSQSVVREQIVRPGEASDLFKLGSGPFPLPFGQSKEDILEQFEVSLVSPVASDPEQTDHLICVSKPGSRVGERFEKVELFVSRDHGGGLAGLPVKVIAHNSQDRTLQTAELSKIKVNPRLHPLKDFAPPDRAKGWDTQSKPLP